MDETAAQEEIDWSRAQGWQVDDRRFVAPTEEQLRELEEEQRKEEEERQREHEKFVAQSEAERREREVERRREEEERATADATLEGISIASVTRRGEDWTAILEGGRTVRGYVDEDTRRAYFLEDQPLSGPNARRLAEEARERA